METALVQAWNQGHDPDLKTIKYLILKGLSPDSLVKYAYTAEQIPLLQAVIDLEYEPESVQMALFSFGTKSNCRFMF